jgi:hypothetical protein
MKGCSVPRAFSGLRKRSLLCQPQTFSPGKRVFKPQELQRGILDPATKLSSRGTDLPGQLDQEMTLQDRHGCEARRASPEELCENPLKPHKTLTGAPRPDFPVELVGVGELHAAFLTESRTRSRRMGPRTGNPGRQSVPGPKTIFFECFYSICHGVIGGVRALEGLCPSYSAHVRWGEHGAPVQGLRSCGLSWVLTQTRKGWGSIPVMISAS